MPNLVAEDDESVSSASPNEGGPSAHEAFKNLKHVTHKRSDCIRANQEMSGIKEHPTLASVARKLSDPAAFTSSRQSNETHSLRKVQKEPDFKEFIKVTEKEIKDHETSDRWEIVHKSEARGRKELKATRAFKRKRNPDR